MMANLGMCHMLRGKWGEAARVAKFGLGCAGEDSSGILWALIAGERLTEGDTQGFLDAFEKVGWYPVSDSHQEMLEPMRVVMAARQKGPASLITIRELKKLAVPTSPYSRRLFLVVRKMCVKYMERARAERARRRRRQ